jgi:hypothetical protein
VLRIGRRNIGVKVLVVAVILAGRKLVAVTSRVLEVVP